ncbi:hypothetical protein HED63_03690 [Ochrobactrum cytisi]|nr:hypothetical protein [Brucella cytisi]
MTGNRKNNEDTVVNLPSDDEQDVAGIIIGDAETDDDDETDDIVDVPASPSAADSIQWDSSDGLPDIEGLSGQHHQCFREAPAEQSGRLSHVQQ